MNEKYFDVSNIRLNEDGVVELSDNELRRISNELPAGGGLFETMNDFLCDAGMNPFMCDQNSNGLICVNGGGSNVGCSNQANCGGGGNGISCSNDIGCREGANLTQCSNAASCERGNNLSCTNTFQSGCAGSTNGTCK
jgi:hypothetical protein